MTQDEAIERLKTAYATHDGDDESLHAEEDEILVAVIRSMGWWRFMNLYDNALHSRWCA